MTRHRPEFRLSTADDGRLTARCLVCMDASQPTLHRPNVEARAEGAREALLEAARSLPGFDGIRTHGDAARWLRNRAEQQANNWAEDCLLMERRAERAEAALRLARQVESDMSERALQAWRSADARRGLSDHAALEVHADALTRWSERFRMAFVGKDYRAERIGATP